MEQEEEIEYEDTNDIVCPYCGSEQEVDEEDYVTEDQVEIKIECRKCGEPFLVIPEVHVMFTSIPYS